MTALNALVVDQDDRAVLDGRFHRLTDDFDDAAAGGIQAVLGEHAQLRGREPLPRDQLRDLLKPREHSIAYCFVLLPDR